MAKVTQRGKNNILVKNEKHSMPAIDESSPSVVKTKNVSCKSGVTVEDSSQSIAQEYNNNESIGNMFTNQPATIANLKQSLGILSNGRLPIMEEEEEELQSASNSRYQPNSNIND